MFSCVFLAACNGTTNNPFAIKFSADSSKIVISGIDEAALLQLQNHLSSDTSYQQLVSVLQTPMDDDSTSMEMEWPGKLSLKQKDLIFTPTQPFVKGKSYLVETIINAQFASAKDIVKSQIDHKVKSQQQLLKR